MAFSSHSHQGAPIGDALDQRLDLGPLRAKLLFYIKRNFDECAASACVLDGGCKGLFFSHDISPASNFWGPNSCLPPIRQQSFLRSKAKNLLILLFQSDPL